MALMKRLGFVGVLVAIFLFIFPFINSHKLFYAPMNAKGFYIYGAALVLAILCGYRIYKGLTRPLQLKKDTVLFWSMFIVLVISSLAAIMGVNPEASFFGDIIRGTGMILIITLAAMAYFLSGLLKKEDWRVAGISIIISSAFYSFLCLIDMMFSPGGETGLSAPQFLFGNSTFAGTFVSVGIVLTFVAILDSYKNNSGNKKWLYPILFLQFLHPAILNSGVWLVNVSISALWSNPGLILGDAQASSVTAFLVAIFVFMRYLVRRFAKAKNSIKLFSGIFGGVTVLVLCMLFIPGSPVQEKYISNSTGARIVLWQSAFEAVKEKPLLGYGPESFELAYQKHFDNRLSLDENLGEIWFDRAHNYFIDTIIEVGFVGLVAWLFLLFILARTFLRASKKGIISETEAHMLTVLICAQILQMQTSFQTVVTYFYMFVLLGYGLYLERKIVPESDVPSNVEKTFIFPVALIVVLISASLMFFVENGRQKDLVMVLKTRDNTAREEKIISAIGNNHSLATLRTGSGSLIKGVMGRLVSDQPLTPEGRSQALKEMGMYGKAYEDYISTHPDYYRARVNLAYLYMFETIMGNERLQEAKDLLAESRVLSPNNPLTPAMEALAYMYGGDFKTAEAKIAEAESMNPKIKFIQDVKAHIALQKTRFPKITFLSLDNL